MDKEYLIAITLGDENPKFDGMTIAAYKDECHYHYEGVKKIKEEFIKEGYDFGYSKKSDYMFMLNLPIHGHIVLLNTGDGETAFPTLLIPDKLTNGQKKYIESISYYLNSTEFLMNIVSDEESLFAPSIHVKKGEFNLDNYNKKYK
jgi:hypothetical protein